MRPKITIIAALLASTPFLHADLVIQTELDEYSCAPWPPSDADLINEGSKDLNLVYGEAEGRRRAITDGLIGGEFCVDTNETETMSYESPEYQINYVLENKDSSNSGYDITEIVSYAGWTQWRVNQIYEVYIKTTSDPEFQKLTEVEFTPIIDGIPEFPNGATRVRIYDDNNEPIAESVVEINFRLKSDPNNPESGSDSLGAMYREFDVIGTPSP